MTAATERVTMSDSVCTSMLNVFRTNNGVCTICTY